jgi:hypothetical protein
MSDDLELQEKRELRSIFVETGHKTLNALLLVSGGTAISFLTFLGAAFKDLAVIEKLGAGAASGFVLSLQAYVLSVAIAVLAYGTTYIGHACYHLKFHRAGLTLAVITVILGFACFFAFAVGSYSAIEALQLALRAVTKATPK